MNYYGFWKEDRYIDKIDPYSFLNVTSNSSYQEVKNSYMKKSTMPDRMTRCKACLSYDIIVNKDKYVKEGKIYRVKKKDCFYYTVIGDLDSLKKAIENNKNLLNEKDGLERSLLYLSARNGYFDLTEYLLKKGININEVQKDGSTALHGAAFYGQELVIQLLLEHGINTKIRNNFGSTADEEARTQKIRDLILKSNDDKIMNLFHDLYKKGLVSNIIPIKSKENGKVIAQKLIISQKLLPNNWENIKKNLLPTWHGTKFKSLESIIRNGLKPAGTKLANGEVISTLEGHYSLNDTIGGIKNWAKAIFVSPSIFYAAHACYAERIMSGNERWGVLVETRIKPNCFTSHNSTVLRDKPIENEPVDVEYRIEVKSDDDLIFRVLSEKNCYIISITFILIDFLENITNYYDSKIVVNSKEERMLLEV